MQVVVWIIIILLIIFLFRLLKRWIKRLIFIIILLVLAFFIYGIFNPSGAARLWYNVRTFPQRVTSWISSGKEFLDYNTYKSKISSIGDNIGEKIDFGIDATDLDLGGKVDIDVDFSEGEEKVEKIEEEKSTKDEDKSDSDEKKVIKSFPKSINFVRLPNISDTVKSDDSGNENKSDNDGVLTSYSKSDLLGVINKYIEKNLDDNTDILVTVEYEDDSSNPNKIILQTQKREKGAEHSVAASGNLVNELFTEENVEDSKSVETDLNNEDENGIIITNDSSDAQVENSTQYVQKTSSNKLTQQDRKEAEEIFSILF